MKVTELIENANRRTERRGEKTLDMKAELLGVIQNFVQDHRWYWRRKSLILNTIVGTTQYDLTAGTSGIDDFEQVAQAGPKLFSSTGVLLGNIGAEHDPDQQDIYAEDETSGTPSKYWISGTTPILNLWPAPDAVYRVRVPYWANPAIDPDGLNDEIPLVPKTFHNILLKGLEAQILRYSLGEGAPKYQAATAEYVDLLRQASSKEDFAPGKLSEWRNQDCRDAVQS